MFQIIKPEELQKNPFTMIGKEWLLITAEKDGKANTMTASWGGVGVLWEKCSHPLHPSHALYKEFVDASDTLSLSVLDESFRKTLNYLGTVSGRDENKIEKAGLTVAHEETPHTLQMQTPFLSAKNRTPRI